MLVVAPAPAAAVGAVARPGPSWGAVAMGGRAVAQSGAVSLPIGAIVGSVRWSALLVAVVVVVAALPIALAPLLVVGAPVLVGVVPPRGVEHVAAAVAPEPVARGRIVRPALTAGA